MTRAAPSARAPVAEPAASSPARAAAVTSATGGRSVAASRPTRPATLLGFGSALPAAAVTSGEIGARFDLTEEWIVERTGIRSRRVLEPGGRLGDLIAAATRDALDAAGQSLADVDLMLVATGTPDDYMPAQAIQVAETLGLPERVLAGDFSAACNGFASATVYAASMIESGRADLAVVCGAEALSRIIDYEDPRSAPLFGDGAAAVVVGPAAPGAGGVGPAITGHDYNRAALYADREERLIKMNGRVVYVNAVERLTVATMAALEAVGATPADLDLLVAHQANLRILEAVGERLGLRHDQVSVAIEDVGNTSAASIPIALAHEYRRGRLAVGGLMVIAGFGGGFTWTAFAVEYPGVSP